MTAESRFVIVQRSVRGDLWRWHSLSGCHGSPAAGRPDGRAAPRALGGHVDSGTRDGHASAARCRRGTRGACGSVRTGMPVDMPELPRLAGERRHTRSARPADGAAWHSTVAIATKIGLRWIQRRIGGLYMRCAHLKVSLDVLAPPRCHWPLVEPFRASQQRAEDAAQWCGNLAATSTTGCLRPHLPPPVCRALPAAGCRGKSNSRHCARARTPGSRSIANVRDVASTTCGVWTSDDLTSIGQD